MFYFLLFTKILDFVREELWCLPLFFAIIIKKITSDNKAGHLPGNAVLSLNEEGKTND